MAAPVDILPGTLDMLIMKALATESMHGFGIARWIERVTAQRLTVDEGALYPALHRMQKRRWLSSAWQTTANNRRAKYYALTRTGRAELARQIDHWKGSAWAVDQVLGTEGG